MVVAVQAGGEFLRQPFLDGRREPPGHHDGGAISPPGGHCGTITRWEGFRASACATVDPSSAGLGATTRPAERMILAFSAAVSPNAEMNAPACPIRRPLGAASPASLACTGFVMFSFT